MSDTTRTFTRKDNILAMLRGEKPRWVPCSINFNQWYQHHKKFNTLPAELAGTADYLDAMRVLGSDFFTRNVATGVRHDYEGVEITRTTEPGNEGPRNITTYHTPYGKLRSISETQTRLTTSYQVEDLVKDWDAEGKAYMWLLERMRVQWDRATAYRTIDRIGDDGIAMIALEFTPLKHLHVVFGLDHACLFAMDHPDESRAICDLYWQKLWPVIEEVAADDRVHAGILMGNIDTPFYPPHFCDLYFTPYVKQATDLFERKGKRLLAHACGQLRGLIRIFQESGLHGLEGMAHPPLGDFRPADAWTVRKGFIYNAGFTAHEQVHKSDDELRQFYDNFFRELAGYPSFVFAAACQTTPDTPWDRIKRVVALCREHGGHPEA